MGTRNMVLSGLAGAAFGLLAASYASWAQETGREALDTAIPPASIIDYSGFADLVNEVAPYREARLVSLADFNAMAATPGTIILDTRSAEAFAEGHIEGAVNLPFSDFTDEKLARVIGPKTTRILIYCNNNFEDDVPPVMLKRVELALNVPTFVNLYGYGYENIYELADLVSMDDPEVNWVKGDSLG